MKRDVQTLRLHVSFWWSIVHSTRTQHLFTGDGFGIVREVEIEYDPVIKDVDRVDKGINDLPLVFRAAHVTLAEFFKPEPNPLTGQDGLFQLFFQNAGVQGFFPGFQLVQTLLGGRGSGCPVQWLPEGLPAASLCP